MDLDPKLEAALKDALGDQWRDWYEAYLRAEETGKMMVYMPREEYERFRGPSASEQESFVVDFLRFIRQHPVYKEKAREMGRD